MTLLLLTRERIVRADVPRGDGPPVIASAPRSADDSLPAAAEAAIALAPTRSATTWVLADEVDRQTLRLSRAALRGLDDEALRRALALETQALTGLAPEASVLAWREDAEAADGRRFQVAQLPARERDEIDDAVTRAGGRLGGILHPAAVPAPLAPDGTGGAWRRIEFWPGIVATVACDDGIELRTDVVRIDPHRWREPDPDVHVPTTVLVAADRRAPAAAFADRVASLADESTLASWLVSWADALCSRSETIPRLLPRPRPLAPLTRVGIAGTGLLAVLALAALHHRGLVERTDGLRDEGSVSSRSAAEIAALRARARALETELAEARTEAAAAQERAALRERLRTQHGLVLRALAAHTPPEAIVDGLDLAVDTSTVRGRCTTPEAADRLAAGLAEALAPQRVALPRRKLRDEEPAAYDFELSIAAPGTSVAKSPATEDRP